MMLLAIDPSSTCVGYALFGEDGKLIEFGRLLPHKGDDAMQRIADLLADLERLWREHRPRTVVIEVTSGKIAGRLGRVQGLGVYGMAVGACWQLLRSLAGARNVRTVTENEWTSGVPKRQRLGLLEARRITYWLANDPGGDAGDAICLGEWFQGQMKLSELEEKT
jgi:hypothetical protein